MENDEPRITGVGGIFFKTENPDETKEWYQKNLGLNTDQWGTNFEWFQGRDATKKGFTQWCPINKKTKHFQPSNKDFMINYRVVLLEKLLQFKNENPERYNEIWFDTKRVALQTNNDDQAEMDFSRWKRAS